MSGKYYDYSKAATSGGVSVADTFKALKNIEGRKDDQGKLRLELIPPELIEGVGSILTFGATRYGDRNWEQGMAWSRVYGALQRHLLAWQKGEPADPDTGKSHLWHAACCVAFLMAYEARGIGTDDRSKHG